MKPITFEMAGVDLCSSQMHEKKESFQTLEWRKVFWFKILYNYYVYLNICIIKLHLSFGDSYSI